MHQKFYLLKIKIIGSNPLIWRKLYVTSSITLDRLHDVIQITMGWENQHSYHFTFNDITYSISPKDESDGNIIEFYHLDKLIKTSGESFKYVYDFRSSWGHEVLVEDTDYKPNDPSVLIKCLNGENACPIEDSGGIDEYIEFCEVFCDSSHPLHPETKSWYRKTQGLKDFDPDDFDRGTTNYELQKYMKWSRDRALKWTDC